MALKITDKCIACGSCEVFCPNNAISEDLQRGQFVIDASRCTECVGFYDNPQCMETCPENCCVKKEIPLM